MKILVINPGSTSTKMAVYEDEKPVLLRNISHTAEELSHFDAITEQQDFRRQLILDELKEEFTKSTRRCWTTHFTAASCITTPAI